MKLLVVIDMQKDFVNGALGTKEAHGIVNNISKKISDCERAGYSVVFTQDTHESNYLSTQEGKNLPVPHCYKGEDGWMLIDELQGFIRPDTKIYEKVTFGSVDLGQDLKRQEQEIEEILLIGVCTDICVISNALLIKAFLPEVNISVDASCCAGVTKESHENALKAMKACQIQVI